VVQGVILAAGRGSRLRPLTDSKPKCLLKLAEKPLLEHQIEAFMSAGISDIIVVSGYLHEQIVQFARSTSLNGGDITIVRNSRFNDTDNMYSLWLTRKLLKKDLIVANGDVVFDPSILIGMLHDKKANLVASDIGSYREENMKIKTINERIVCIKKDLTRSDSFATTLDIYRIGESAAKRLFELIKANYIEKRDLKQWIEVALQDLFNQVTFYPFDIGARKWIEIDTYDDLRNARHYTHAG
jgi:choline kinase